MLAQAIERPLIRLRPLGASTIVEIESRATVFATGNNLRVRGDMVRRSLVCDLDAGMERPETRQFRSNPVETVLKDRGRYVSACLIIVRAYIAAGRPNTLPKLASFEDWSNLVRSALVWLGCADPLDSMEAARNDDPELAELREVLTLWNGALGTDAHTAKEIVGEAERRHQTIIGEPTDPVHPELLDTLTRLFGERGTINTKRLVRWLMAREGRIVGCDDGQKTVQLRFKRALSNAMGGLARWRCEKA